jgi:hypothetical protein
MVVLYAVALSALATAPAVAKSRAYAPRLGTRPRLSPTRIAASSRLRGTKCSAPTPIRASAGLGGFLVAAIQGNVRYFV